jgi:1,4-dihydroxy-2-naphthoate octaprenyltransferase
MGNPSKTQIWLAQFRANFLILAVLLVAIGLALSYKHLLAVNEHFNWFNAILLLIGTISAHSSVNLFNEYSDFKTKIDFNTLRNPFSGGSGMLPSGNTKPGSVLFVAILTLVISAAIGVYFSFVSHWSIALTIIIGGFAIVFYTDYLAKMLLGEFFAGFALGSLVVMGVYVAMTAHPQMSLSGLLPNEVWLLSIPPGILTSLLLFINEFPDMEADKVGGRHHLVIRFGRKISAYIYTYGLVAVYLTVILLPIFHISSYWTYIALLTLPVAIKVCLTAIKDYDNMEKIIPALGQNVLIVLGTDLLIASAVMLQLI